MARNAMALRNTTIANFLDLTAISLRCARWRSADRPYAIWP